MKTRVANFLKHWTTWLILAIATTSNLFFDDGYANFDNELWEYVLAILCDAIIISKIGGLNTWDNFIDKLMK